MFAHEIILAKTGPLARIWLAAHWDKKLKKKDIFETKLVESVENIINPKMKLALRTSGHLLLGVVKIYSRKTGFLYTDCNEAIVKLRSAFRTGAINDSNPKESKTKAKAQQLFFTSDLDLPDIDTPIPDLNDLDLDKNRARLEEITLREENDFLNVDDLELNGDEAYNSELAIDLDNEEMMRNLNEVFGDNQIDTFNNEESSLLIDDDGLKTETEFNDGQEMSGKIDEGIESAEKMIDDLQNPLSVAPSSVAPNSEVHGEPAPSPMSHYSAFSNPASPSNITPPMSPAQGPRPDAESTHLPMEQTPTPIAFGNINRPVTPMSQRAVTPQPMPDQPPTPISNYQEAASPISSSKDIENIPIQTTISTNQAMNNIHQKLPEMQRNPNAQATIQRMNLRERKEPTQQQIYQSMDHPDLLVNNRRRRVRRQLIIDQQIGIDAETMRAQLRDHSDIVGSLVMAPPVEKLLRSKEESNIDTLFKSPIGRIHSGLLQTCFQANLRIDLPACAILRQEEANVESFSEEDRRQYSSMHQSNNINQHDSDDEDMYSYGPPSVASSYADEHQISQPEHHEISHQDTQWAKATGQDIRNIENNIPVESMPPAEVNPEINNSNIPLPNEEANFNVSKLPTLLHKPEMYDSQVSPKYMKQIPQEKEDDPPASSYNSYQEPVIPDPPSPVEDSSDDLQQSCEPLPKRLRTESAEEELKDIEAGKGTAACIKYTQRLLSENDVVSFNDMTTTDNRKLASQKFYSLLVMLKHEQITATQANPYSDILINKGVNFGGVISDHC